MYGLTSLTYGTGACEGTLARPSEHIKPIYTPRAFHARIWDDERNSKCEVSVVHCLLHYTIFQTELIVPCASCRFLGRCAKWIGEGPHMELLEILLDLGFDATVIDSPHVQDWPEPSSPDWIAEYLTPDPFFVEYQSMLLRDNQGKLQLNLPTAITLC
jgi:hypothetical protein